MHRLSRLPDTPIGALATGPTSKRPGHTGPAGFTGGNLEDGCIRHAS